MRGDGRHTLSPEQSIQTTYLSAWHDSADSFSGGRDPSAHPASAFGDVTGQAAAPGHPRVDEEPLLDRVTFHCDTRRHADNVLVCMPVLDGTTARILECTSASR